MIILRYFDAIYNDKVNRMMFDEEDKPIKQNFVNLEPLSLNELEKYIVELNQEIDRTQDEIKRKKSHMDAASSIFKS